MAIDRTHPRLVGDLLRGLRDTPEGNADLLANTTALMGSNLDDAHRRPTTNLPVLVAGGRFRHAGSLRFDRDRSEPLPGLFVGVLQQRGQEIDRFAGSTTTLRGLDRAGASVVRGPRLRRGGPHAGGVRHGVHSSSPAPFAARARARGPGVPGG